MSETSTAPVPTAGSTRTVERALSLLAEVCAERSIGLAECARRTELPASTALRLLRTLESSGFVSRDERGSFEAGPRLIQLGAVALGRQSLVTLGQPALQRLVAATGETAYVSVLGPGGSALSIAMLEGTHAVRHAGWVGRTVPLRGTAVGAALLRPVPPEGFVVKRSVAEPDVTTVAARISRPGGVAGVLSIVGPTYRLDARSVSRFGAVVAGEAQSISAKFGTQAAPGA